jgi:hypothetical protein
MRLTQLITEIERSPGAVTIGDLAGRLGVTTATVTAGLAALRAAGRLGPQGGAEPGTHECASTGSCAVSCPGPDECPFVLDIGVGLEVRRR